MKILVAADMEGVSGVTNWDQVDPEHFEYPRFRVMMTAEVNAAVQGALGAGASEVIVADGHAGGTNILLEDLDPRARLNAGTPSPHSMVQGVDTGVTAAFFVGYHARAGTRNAILDHTYSSQCVLNLWLNDLLVGETGINAALCGHFNVPVIMVSGDQSVCAEAQDLLGKIEVAVVKHASGRTAADCIPHGYACEKICEAAGRATNRLAQGDAPPPFRLPEPIIVKLELTHSGMVDRAALFAGVRRLDGRTVEFEASDMIAAYRGLRAIVSLARG